MGERAPSIVTACSDLFWAMSLCRLSPDPTKGGWAGRSAQTPNVTARTAARPTPLSTASIERAALNN